MFITINHIGEYAGAEMFRPGMTLSLKKEKNNPYDDEAITVYSERGSKYGYVANSVCSVCRGTHSAGYIYQSFGEETKCIVRFVAEDFAIAELFHNKQEQG